MSYGILTDTLTGSTLLHCSPPKPLHVHMEQTHTHSHTHIATWLPVICLLAHPHQFDLSQK